jgi:hypothetical protein
MFTGLEDFIVFDDFRVGGAVSWLLFIAAFSGSADCTGLAGDYDCSPFGGYSLFAFKFSRFVVRK